MDVLSRDHGQVAMVARGVRGKQSRWSGLLQPLNSLILSWTGRSDLKTLTAVESRQPVLTITGTALYCGLYMNELLMRFLQPHDPHPDLFSCYAASLTALAENAHMEQTLRFFETALLQEVGYGLELDHEACSGKTIKADKYYRYVVERGPVESRWCGEAIRGATLIGLRKHSLKDPTEFSEAKKLLRRVIEYHLGDKPLQSRALFKASKRRSGSL